MNGSSLEVFTASVFVTLVGLPLVVIALIAALVQVAVFVACALPSLDSDNWLTRRVQRGRLLNTRLAAVLNRLGVDAPAYARLFAVPVLRDQIDSCRRCRRQADCDRFIQRRPQGQGEFALDYCPNAAMIRWAVQQPHSST